MADTQLPPGVDGEESRQGRRRSQATDSRSESRTKELSGLSRYPEPTLLHIHIFSQTHVGTQLTTLETRWTELISSVLQIEMANIALDVEIDRLNRREAELAEQL